MSFTIPMSRAALMNHIWSFAGNEQRTYVSRIFLEPFVSYATKTKTIFTVNTESTYDWKDGRWTVPFNFTLSQILRVGKLPISFSVGARYYAQPLRAGPDCGLRSLINPIFTTTKTASHPVSNANGTLVD
jgi:hypothetical protein